MCVNGVDDSIRFRYIHTMGKISERSHIKACVQHHDPTGGPRSEGKVMTGYGGFASG